MKTGFSSDDDRGEGPEEFGRLSILIGLDDGVLMAVLGFRELDIHRSIPEGVWMFEYPKSSLCLLRRRFSLLLFLLLLHFSFRGRQFLFRWHIYNHQVHYVL